LFYADMLASKRYGTLYTGSTDDLIARIDQHRAKRFSGFTAKYGVNRLVWFEAHPSREQAFRRERQIKEWKRLWKLQLIESRNPNWLDLFDDIDRAMAEEEQRGLSSLLPGSRLSPG
jgi:putative endonuclease